MKKGIIIPTLLLCVGIFLIFCTFSCKRNKDANVEVEPESEPVEYPVSIIPDNIATNVSDKQVLYPVSEDFLRDFMLLASRYEGTQVMTQTSFPTEWGVIMIERLLEGKELWMLQSESREWIYLVVTSGLGTQRILDILPVAVNLAVQDNDILETEIWTTKRDADGSFLVEKTYEWIKSVPDDATKEEFALTPKCTRKRTMSPTSTYLTTWGVSNL